jgi:hypothetical protein
MSAAASSNDRIAPPGVSSPKRTQRSYPEPIKRIVSRVTGSKKWPEGIIFWRKGNFTSGVKLDCVAIY